MKINSTQASLSICFCAWNEENNILTCINDAVAYAEAAFSERYEIFVIDNASTDSTPQVVLAQGKLNPRIKLHRHEENRLYSGSYCSAFAVSNSDFIVVLDGDFQHTCKDIDRALQLIKTKNVDVVYGWKKQRCDGILRDLFSVGLRLVSKILIGHDLHDINCGFRVLKNKAAKTITIQEKVNSVGPELYCEIRRLNLTVGEIVVTHFARSSGGGIHTSLIPLLKGTKKFFTYLVRLHQKYGAKPVMNVNRL